MPNKPRKKIRKEKQDALKAIEVAEPLVYDEDNPEHAKKIPRDNYKTDPDPERPDKPVGRPTVMTKQVLNKLEHAFKIGCTDREACIHAGISLQTLYNYCKRVEEFVEQKEDWKELNVLAARANISYSLRVAKSISDSWAYLQSHRKEEFSTQKNVAVTNPNALTREDLERAANAGVIIAPDAS